MIALAATQIRQGDRVFPSHGDFVHRGGVVAKVDRVDGERLRLTYKDGWKDTFDQLDRLRIAERV